MTRNIIGLRQDEIEASRKKYGNNTLKKEKQRGFIGKFFENLNDPIIKVLIIALVAEVIFTLGQVNFFEIFGIAIAILIATTVSTVSEFGSERAFLKMQEESKNSRVRVYREGLLCEISADELVVGDIMIVSAGEKIHADGVIIDGVLKVDQSALNGESKDVTKKKGRGGEVSLNNPSLVFRGSIVVSGEALVRVRCVGENTYYGMVAKDVQSETRKSPLKLRLAALASQISKIGYVMAGIVGFAYLFTNIVSENGYILSRILEDLKDVKFLISTLSHALTLMITVVVVAAPEGLPMMITVVLSANMKKMLKDGVLVKKLVGIETAGSMNILFTDKTGTLTTGKLECDRVITAKESYTSLASIKKSNLLYEIITENAYYNSASKISGGEVVGGNSTDVALAVFAKSEKVKSRRIIKQLPFTSENKYSSVTLEGGREIIKGAPEKILPLCECAYGADTFSLRELENLYRQNAEGGSRVIALAYRDGGEHHFTFVAFLILKDKLRRGVRDAVIGVKKAGVQVVMLTGDGKETAKRIAIEAGILNGEAREIVLTSDELSRMSDEEIKGMLPNLRVLARALPQDKTRLVRLSQELELVAGMTGDGINDAPSLKLADVGFAMGNGADIAKEAGDIVLLDNSFYSINRTILYGRTIFKSIRKFITFQLIMNIAACGVSLFGQFLGIESPITIIQMLWVNIIMDTLGGLAFAGEAPLEYYMKEKPKRRSEPLLSREMLYQIFFDGAFTLLICIGFLKMDFFQTVFRHTENNLCFMTAFYALFIFAGIFNCFGARCERLNVFANIEKNKAFIFIMLLISVIQIFMIYYGGALFRAMPLLAGELLRVVLLAALVLPFEMLRRILFKICGK